MTYWRNKTQGIADESLAAFDKHGESFYYETLTDPGSAGSNSDPHPSEVVCTRAGDRSAEELHSNHTATILPAGDATEKKVLQILHAQRACACMLDCVRSSAQDVLPWK